MSCSPWSCSFTVKKPPQKMGQNSPLKTRPSGPHLSTVTAVSDVQALTHLLSFGGHVGILGDGWRFESFLSRSFPADAEIQPLLELKMEPLQKRSPVDVRSVKWQLSCGRGSDKKRIALDPSKTQNPQSFI
ncbi:hypothetical protein GHT09_015293 [Marmota monax]|uniref:Uncharacterized protein n=1 Tax=Marmota monax TaxID=9995 RepID=A0A834UJV6_MARMO|nr:hypothetical protein GHT09_015293 [Marmota monax]KAF7461292.1 hypothetical protein GHT09_015293 [Marmota monax]